MLEHSVKFGEFTLKSGATSSWFLDTKQTACRADGIVAVTDAVLEVFGDVFDDIDAIGGLTMGSDPVAYGVAAVAATRGHHVRSFSVRKEAKQGGITGRIAGALSPGDRVLVTEDTTTRGTSLIEAADQIARVRCRPDVDDGDRRSWRHVRGDGGGGRDRLPPAAHRARPRLRLRHLSHPVELSRRARRSARRLSGRGRRG